MATGVGSCENTCSGGANIRCCNNGTDCNKFVTSCYNIATRKNVECDKSGGDKYCQVFSTKISFHDEQNRPLVKDPDFFK